MKRNAIGVVEVNYFANSVIVVDAMLKAAEVELVSCHKTLGGRMVHTIVAGETSAVDATIEAANATESIIGKDNLKVAVTISNPHPEIIKLLNLIR
ncbi:MAG: BMC domain-containing protein [Mobilitalea sp.]